VSVGVGEGEEKVLLRKGNSWRWSEEEGWWFNSRAFNGRGKSKRQLAMMFALRFPSLLSTAGNWELGHRAPLLSGCR